MVCMANELEVFNSIIGFNSVEMMHVFVRVQRSPKILLHDPTMLFDVDLGVVINPDGAFEITFGVDRPRFRFSVMPAVLGPEAPMRAIFRVFSAWSENSSANSARLVGVFTVFTAQCVFHWIKEAPCPPGDSSLSGMPARRARRG